MIERCRCLFCFFWLWQWITDHEEMRCHQPELQGQWRGFWRREQVSSVCELCWRHVKSSGRGPGEPCAPEARPGAPPRFPLLPSAGPTSGRRPDPKSPLIAAILVNGSCWQATHEIARRTLYRKVTKWHFAKCMHGLSVTTGRCDRNHVPHPKDMEEGREGSRRIEEAARESTLEEDMHWDPALCCCWVWARPILSSSRCWLPTGRGSREMLTDLVWRIARLRPCG